jgi:Gpi18-like mannosyltransferase
MNNKNLWRGLWLIFLCRFALALLPSFQVDMGAWLAWGSRLAEVGTANFYSEEVWTQYTPGFLYWLLAIGRLGWVHPLAIKVPVIIADMFTGYLIWKVVGKRSNKWANWAYVIYVLNPAMIIDGSIWGQIDGLLALAMFGSTYLLIEKKNCYASWIVAGVALLIKPQAIAMMPVLLGLTLIRFGVVKTLKSGLLTVSVIALGFYPFYPNNLLGGMWELMEKMGVSYPYTSLFAFNVWSFMGMWKLDNTIWMGMSYFAWGTIAMTGAFGGLILRYRKLLTDNSVVYLVFALACYIFFLFPTRVHERYLIPMFAYLIAYAGVKHNKWLWVIVAGASALYSLNLYLPYSYYEAMTNPLKNIGLENWIQDNLLPIATVQILIFVVLWLFPARDQSKKSVPELSGHSEAVEQGRD